ncbi:DUF1643 domain-containing protein [Streptomyces sp. NPDC060001]|uniref:DUF1643 domain-containing protein n=1 Tax=Streptomyces sp. NPDC060001 TaxID=3347032 RepID=UPI00368430F7
MATLLPDDIQLPVHVDKEPLAGGGIASAVLSKPGRQYRYLLTRIWDRSVTPMVFVMLNPSTADAMVDDPTIRRCMGFARREEAGGLVVANLFALRSTNPRVLQFHSHPTGGATNDAFIRQAAGMSPLVVAAWGAAGVLHDRGMEVTGMLRDGGVRLRCLGTTSTGQPRHPLYLPGAAQIVDYVPEGSS